MSCWTRRRTAADRCNYGHRAEDPGCDECALQSINDQGLTPAQQDRLRAHQREQAAAARLREQQASQYRSEYGH